MYAGVGYEGTVPQNILFTQRKDAVVGDGSSDTMPAAADVLFQLNSLLDSLSGHVEDHPV